jgi:hypothetical protein
MTRREWADASRSPLGGYLYLDGDRLLAHVYRIGSTWAWAAVLASGQRIGELFDDAGEAKRAVLTALDAA